MAACYAPDARFSDPVFDLAGGEVGAMWSMLCERGRDLRVEWRDVRADDASGAAHWEAALYVLRHRPSGAQHHRRRHSPSARAASRATWTPSTCGAGAAWRSAPRARCSDGRRSCATRSSARRDAGWMRGSRVTRQRRARADEVRTDEVQTHGSAWPTRLNRRSRTTACRASACCSSTSARPMRHAFGRAQVSGAIPVRSARHRNPAVRCGSRFCMA